MIMILMMIIIIKKMIFDYEMILVSLSVSVEYWKLARSWANIIQG